MLGLNNTGLCCAKKADRKDTRPYPQISGKDGIRVKTKKQKEAEEAGKVHDWKLHYAQVGEYLLSHGHINALGYTLRQAVTFFYIAHKRIRGEYADQMGLARIAYHADNKQYKKALKELE